MRRADRLFQIVQHLRGGRLVTAQKLGAWLEVSERTIYRDIADLMAQRVPIRGEAGVGYVLDGGYDLPPLMLTPDEIEAAVLGAKLRFRAVMMTSFAFIAGLIPLVLATGAAMLSRRGVGTAVFGGMVSATVLGISTLAVQAFPESAAISDLTAPLLALSATVSGRVSFQSAMRLSTISIAA